MILEFSKVRSDAITPTRSNPSDAGMDIYYCPAEKITALQVPSLGKALLPSGIRVSIPHGYALEIKNRSSVASKKGLIIGGELIDAGYEGEIMIDLHNISNRLVTILPGDKIAQFVVYPIVQVRLSEVSQGSLFDTENKPITMSDRRDGGFGSTDAKVGDKNG